MPQEILNQQMVGTNAMDPAAAIGQGMSEEDMVANLENDFNKVENANNALESSKFVFRNRLKQVKLDVLKKVYESLWSLGVDPTNLDSIGKFLQKLEQQDPDLLALFQMIFENLDPNELSKMNKGSVKEGGISGAEEMEEPAGLMNRYTNLQEQVLRK